MVEEKVYHREKGDIVRAGTSGRIQSRHDPELCEERRRERGERETSYSS